MIFTQVSYIFFLDGDIRRAASMTDLSINALNRRRLFSTPTNSKDGGKY